MIVVLVHVFVVLVVLLAARSFRLGASSAQVYFSRMLRTHGAQGQHSLQILAVALGAGGNVSFTDELFEGIRALSTGIFVDWHTAKNSAALARLRVPLYTPAT